MARCCAAADLAVGAVEGLGEAIHLALEAAEALDAVLPVQGRGGCRRNWPLLRVALIADAFREGSSQDQQEQREAGPVAAVADQSAGQPDAVLMGRIARDGEPGNLGGLAGGVERVAHVEEAAAEAVLKGGRPLQWRSGEGYKERLVGPLLKFPEGHRKDGFNELQEREREGGRERGGGGSATEA